MRFSLQWLFFAVFYAAAGCDVLAPSYNGPLDAACNFAFAALCLVALVGSLAVCWHVGSGVGLQATKSDLRHFARQTNLNPGIRKVGGNLPM